MKQVFKKTTKEQDNWTRVGIGFGILLVIISMYFLLSLAGKHVDATDVNYENVVQSTIMTYKIKVAAGLYTLGTLLSYANTWFIAHSPLGRWLGHWDETKDDSASRAAKIKAMALIFGAHIVGVFTLLSSVLK